MLDKKVVSRMRKDGRRKVLVQMPEGLKTKALYIAKELEGSGFEAFMHSDACYGACDIADCEAARLGCDCILHIGHSGMGIKSKVPVYYDEWRMKADPVPILEKRIGLLKPAKTVALVTTVQYLDGLEPARKYLESQGKKVLTARPKRAAHEGQVLGCDFSAAVPLEKRADVFLYMGTGMFHPMGLSMRVSKPVLFLNLELGNMINVHKERELLERMRITHLEESRDKKRFGILISTKPGQANPGLALELKKKLESKGKEAFLISATELSPEKLMGMELDALVNTACPRIAEDYRQYKKPILYPEDVDKL